MVPLQEQDMLAYFYGFNGVQKMAGKVLYLFYTDQYQYQPGDSVRMTLLKVNTGIRGEVFTYLTTQYYDFMIKGSEGIVWRWSKDKFFLQVIQTKFLRPGEMAAAQEIWQVPENIAKGVYRLAGRDLAGQQLKLQLFIEVCL